jgi:hypothetical protein
MLPRQMTIGEGSHEVPDGLSRSDSMSPGHCVRSSIPNVSICARATASRVGSRSSLRWLALWTTLAVGATACTPEEDDEEIVDIDAILEDLGFDPIPPPPRDIGVDVPEDIQLPRLIDGQPCTLDDRCLGGDCYQDPEWDRGYCTRYDCTSNDDCEAGRGICLAVDEFLNMCVAPCEASEDCREGYECRAVVDGGQLGCLPDDAVDPGPSGALDGEPCALDTDCQGGYCLQDPAWPAGYCTTPACRTAADCASAPGIDNRCFLQINESYCVRRCAEQSDCREGYTCQRYGVGSLRCAPDVTVPVVPDVPPPAPTDTPLTLTCVSETDGNYDIVFEVPAGTTSWMLGLFARDGYELDPLTLQTPNRTIELYSAEGVYLNATSTFLRGIGVIAMPVAPRFDADVVPGTHTVTVDSRSEDLCWYVLRETTPGTTIDFNVYLVDVPGVLANTAPSNPQFVAVFDAFDRILAPAGIQTGTVRYYDAPEDVADEYGIIRSGDDVQELVERSVLPGDSVDEALSMNVFFTRGFNFRGANVIGMSTGLPGLAGMHSTASSGVVFTSEYMFLGNDGLALTGVLFAHEVGHYLGLFHTTEFDGVTTDPLADTFSCGGDIRSNPEGCPDINNVMFPLADVSHVGLTSEQGAVLRANPLTRD